MSRHFDLGCSYLRPAPPAAGDGRVLATARSFPSMFVEVLRPLTQSVRTSGSFNRQQVWGPWSLRLNAETEFLVRITC